MGPFGPTPVPLYPFLVQTLGKENGHNKSLIVMPSFPPHELTEQPLSPQTSSDGRGGSGTGEPAETRVTLWEALAMAALLLSRPQASLVSPTVHPFLPPFLPHHFPSLLSSRWWKDIRRGASFNFRPEWLTPSVTAEESEGLCTSNERIYNGLFFSPQLSHCFYQPQWLMRRNIVFLPFSFAF